MLDGGAGADRMEGGEGDDIYHVDTTADQTLEAASSRIDVVVSSVNWTLAAETEHLELAGAAANGIGNALANSLTGNGAANTLQGLAGNDTLDGGLGNDKLEGGLGADTYVFGLGYGKDTVTEKDASDFRDRVDFGSLNHDAVKFTHVGNDLEVKITGTSDKLVIKNWYLGTKYQVEDFVFADGTWTGDQVAPAANRLIDAMAEFNGGEDGSDPHPWGRARHWMGQADLASPVAIQ